MSPVAGPLRRLPSSGYNIVNQTRAAHASCGIVFYDRGMRIPRVRLPKSFRDIRLV